MSQVASVTVRRKPFQGCHRNWALVAFFNSRAAEACIAMASSMEGIVVVDRHEVSSRLVCRTFDIEKVFKNSTKAKEIWEEQRNAIAKGIQTPWWYGDKNDYSFLVKLYRPSMYWFGECSSIQAAQVI